MINYMHSDINTNTQQLENRHISSDGQKVHKNYIHQYILEFKKMLNILIKYYLKQHPSEQSKFNKIMDYINGQIEYLPKDQASIIDMLKVQKDRPQEAIDIHNNLAIYRKIYNLKENDIVYK